MKKLGSFLSNSGGSSKLRRSSVSSNEDTTIQEEGPLPLGNEFHYEKGVCALEYWEPVKLLSEGSISDIHLVRRRSKRIYVRYKKKRDIMKFAKSNAGEIMNDEEEEDLFVLKSIMKDHVDDDFVLDEMRRELQTLSKLDHPNIVKLYEAYERRRHIYLIMDYCPGGDLTDRHFTKAQCAVVISKILSAVAYMHDRGVVHRDLKLENVVLDKESTPKIIDFGLATKYLSDEHKVMTDRVGTIYTMAPQVLQGVYDSKCDMWSIGVIAFMLLSDINPFWGPPRPMPWSKRRKVMIDRIMRCQYQHMTGPAWEKISPAAINFCASLLQMDPDDRPTAREALELAWIRSVGSSSVWNKRVASKQEQQSRRAISKLKQVAIQLLAQELMDEDAMDLRSEFEKYDGNRDGHIQLKDFRKVLEDSTIKIASPSLDDMFADPSLDMTCAIEYNDFIIKVLADRDRTITEMTAEALDGLDVEGVRKVDKEKLLPALEGILSPALLDKILQELTVDDDGKVSTIVFLEVLDKSLATYLRRSLRTIGSEHQEETENDLIDETNAIIPGGRRDNPQKPKFVYETMNKSMRKVEYEA